MKTTSINPPIIKQLFSKRLLGGHYPKFRESSSDLLSVYNYLLNLLKKKTKSGKNDLKKKECEKLIKEFNELYASILTKEKEREAEKGHFTQRPFYWIPSVGSKGEPLFKRLEFRAMFKRMENKFWKDY